MAETERRNIPVKDLVLDIDNPRMYHHGVESADGQIKLADSEIEKDIQDNDNDLPELIKSIQAEGVREAIYVKETKGKKYIVMEGNRRTVAMRQLCEQGYTNDQKPEIDYCSIPANVIHKDTSELEIYKDKVIWQTGKSAWGAYQTATAAYNMRHKFMMSTEDIAAVMQKSDRDVKAMLKSVDTFREYANETGDTNTSRYSFFSKECPTQVRTWYNDSPENKDDYFMWINPKGGGHRLRSVATRGGLRDFKEIVTNESAIREFREDPRMTVEEALEIVKDQDITKGRPWLKQIEKVAQGINDLENSEIERLLDEGFRPKLVTLKRAINHVLGDQDD